MGVLDKFLEVMKLDNDDDYEDDDFFEDDFVEDLEDFFIPSVSFSLSNAINKASLVYSLTCLVNNS